MEKTFEFWMSLLVTPFKSILGSLKILLGLLLIPIEPLAAPLIVLAEKPKKTQDILTEVDTSKSKTRKQQVALPESVNFHFTRCSLSIC